MKNKLYKSSILLNILFLLGIIFISFRKKDKILDFFNPQRYNVIMVGHSLTGGCNWNKELDRSDIKNDGMGGASTFNFVSLVFEDVIKRKPKICFIDGGMNDICYGIPLTKTFENYILIVDSLSKHNIKPVLQSTLYSHHQGDSMENNYVDSVNYFLKDLALKKGLYYLNHNQYLSKNRRLDEKYTKDGYHINEAANKIWVREVKIILEKENI